MFLIGFPGGGGEEVFVRDLAAHPPPGFRYRLAMHHHQSVPGAEARTGEERLFNRLVHPWLHPLPGLRSYRVEPEIQLVHVHNFPHRLAMERTTPVVMSVGGGSYPHYLTEYLGWSDSAVARTYARARRIYRTLGIRDEVARWEEVSAILVFSEMAASVLAGLGVPRSRLHVVPPGFDVPPETRPIPPPDPFTFLLVGRDPFRKGADLAVTALRQLRHEGMQVRLILVGDPAYNDLEGEPGFEVHLRVPRGELLREVFPRAHVLLLPSRAEGFGFTLVEGMSLGIPGIATRRDAFPEILGEEEAGLLVEPGSLASLKTAMARLATNPAEVERLGRAARSRFLDRFAREHQARALGRIYGTLLGQGAA